MSNELELPTGEPDASALEAEAKVVDRASHNISRKEIPENVLKVLYRLHRSGYRAYLCGGSVRDLLMNRQPKDFDIATDAHPMEIRRLFRNSRIIGRRFRLVHILFQDMTVEVSTFRKEPEGKGEDEDLLVTNDNTFGSPLEDARRRDFTINGMFYNIADFSVIDYVGGLTDLSDGCIRVIGQPDLRFREDPVRMMRAVEFASRLDFSIEPETYEAIIRHHADILKASPPRVAEEILELLRRGWSRDAIELLLETRLLESLLPELSSRLQKEAFVYFWKMLEVLDRTIESGRRVPDGVLLAVLFLPLVLDELEGEEQERQTKLRISEVILFLRDVLSPMLQRMALPAGLRHQLEQIFESLWRLLEPPADRRSMWRFVLRENFADALALFELFALSSGQHVENYRQWQAFSQRVRRAGEDGVEKPPPTKRRRRTRKRPQ